MIVSASRRTDIPALYAPWLVRRLEAGHCLVPHPFNRGRVRRIDLRPAPEGEMEALVLWTRDPGPLLEIVPRWDEAGVRTLWLVTVTGYPRALEPGAPKWETAARNLTALAERVGPERVVWRYDPVVLVPGLGMDERWHGENFHRIAGCLAGAVRRCIMSWYDDYGKARKRLQAAALTPDVRADPLALTARLASAAAELGMTLQSCCEALEPAGVRPGACIDGPLLDRLWGLGVGTARDPGQRAGCRCAPAADIGVYDTCTHGCLYCYASGPPGRSRAAVHDPDSETLA